MARRPRLSFGLQRALERPWGCLRGVLSLAAVLALSLSPTGSAHNPAGSPSQATGATVQLKTIEGQSPVTAKLVYRSSGDDADRVRVDLEVMDGAAVAYIVRAEGGASPGPGCSGTEQPGVLRCAIPSGAVPTGPDMHAGEGNDRVSVSPSLHAGAVLAGGPGNDRLRGGQHLIGGPGNDSLLAATGSGSRLEGGSGNDQISGWMGPDFIVGGSGWDRVDATDGNDVIVASDDRRDHVICGYGTDHVRADGVDLLDPDYWDGDRGPDDVCERITRSTPARAVPGTSLESGVVPVSCPRDLPRGCTVDARVSMPHGRVVWATKHWRIRAGRTDVAVFYRCYWCKALKTTVITYPRHGKPRKAAAVFHYEPYGGE